ncbi:kinase-like domain-containing protein [Apiospora hydei]|uniref:Kinase-like domain-containing protein n=1 Tax=Apiospora hydei TaxID=1337664 RepID=A0ABR1V4J7_9PEZI
MAATQSEAEIQSKVLRTLEGTPFAATSLVPLSGGTANFIYLADLAQPLDDGVRRVLVKHGEGFLASNPGFQLSTSRCHIEDVCLQALSSSSIGAPTAHSDDGYGYVVRTPKHYPFPEDPNTQIQEYLPKGTNLKAYALKHWSSSPTSSPAAGESTTDVQQTQAHQLGLSLGRWLRAFHDSSELHREELRGAIAKNSAMQSLKHTINFQWLLDRVAQFPDILTEAVPVFEEVKEMAAAELRDESRLQVIHGDFWTGNHSLTIINSILLPNTAPTPQPLEPAEPVPVPLFVVDWEMAQLGLPNLDLGQMLAEMYELWLYKQQRAGLWMMAGFVTGYGPVAAAAAASSEAFALRTAVQLGAHLVCFGTSVPGWGAPEQVREVARAGRDILYHAWCKDRAWFEEGERKDELACLFSTVKGG